MSETPGCTHLGRHRRPGKPSASRKTGKMSNLKLPAKAEIRRLDVCEAAGGRFFVIEPLAGRRIVAQGKREAGASCAALGQRPDPFNPLPQPVCWVGGEGSVRGKDPAELRKSRFVPRNVWRTTKRETRHSVTNGPPLPTTPPESLKSGDSGGVENNGLER